jgi:hypothetical protein
MNVQELNIDFYRTYHQPTTARQGAEIERILDYRLYSYSNTNPFLVIKTILLSMKSVDSEGEKHPHVMLYQGLVEEWDKLMMLVGSDATPINI